MFCFDDGSQAMERLEQMGATLIGMDDLQDLSALKQDHLNLFEQ